MYINPINEEVKPSHAARMPPAARRYSSEEAAPLVMHVHDALEAERLAEADHGAGVGAGAGAGAGAGTGVGADEETRLLGSLPGSAVATEQGIARTPSASSRRRRQRSSSHILSPSHIVAVTPEMAVKRKQHNNHPLSLGALRGARVFKRRVDGVGGSDDDGADGPETII